MKKKLLNLFLIICITLGISSSAYALPKDIVIIGNQAFEIGTLFLPEYLDLINGAINDADDLFFYNLSTTGNEFKSLFKNKEITKEEKSVFKNIKLSKANGEIAIYKTFDDTNPTIEDFTNGIANASVEVGTISSFKNITINSLNHGTKYTIEGVTGYHLIGEKITTVTSSDTLTITVFDDVEQIGTFEITVNNAATSNYIYKIENNDENNNEKKSNISINIGSISTFKNITVNSSNVGIYFKVDYSTNVATIGNSININTAETTCKVYFLNSSQQVLGTVTLNLNSESTGNYNIN